MSKEATTVVAKPVFVSQEYRKALFERGIELEGFPRARCTNQPPLIQRLLYPKAKPMRKERNERVFEIRTAARPD